MTIADIILIIGGISGIASIFIQVRRDRNKAVVDESSASKNFAETIVMLNKQLADNGKTIKDLFDDMAEIPQLRSEVKTNQGELKVAQNSIKKLEDDLTAQVRRADFFISFARDYWQGSRKLYAQVVKSSIEPPEFVPAEKFPTGPLSAGSTS